MLMDFIKNPFKKKYSQEETDFINFFRQTVLFDVLEDSEILEFKPYIYERSYAESEVVFHQGDPSKAMFFIKSGRVQLRMHLQQTHKRVLTLTTGQSLGENCLVEDKPRPVSAIVMEKSVIYVLAKTDIEKVFAQDKDIPSKILAKFGELYYDWTLKVIAKLLSKSIPVQEGVLDFRTRHVESTTIPPPETRS